MLATGPVVFLDSLLMVHPWQHADGYGFGVNLNTIFARGRAHKKMLFGLSVCSPA
jgi:hypothetical protein